MSLLAWIFGGIALMVVLGIGFVLFALWLESYTRQPLGAHPLDPGVQEGHLHA